MLFYEKGDYMQYLTLHKGNIQVPVIPHEIDISLKSEYLLDVNQLFLLESLENGNTISELSEALLLNPNAISMEIQRLLKQGLLETQGDGFVLTDVSRKIVEAGSWCNSDWQKKKTAWYHPIKKEFILLEESTLTTEQSEYQMTLPESHSIEEKDLLYYLRVFGCLESIPESIQNSLVECLEVTCTTQRQPQKYLQEPVHWLPCYFSKRKQPLLEDSPTLIVSGTVTKLTVEINHPTLENQKDTVEKLKEVASINQKFLSKKAVDLMKEFDDYMEMKGRQQCLYLDSATKILQKTLSTTEKASYPQLKLPPQKPVTPAELTALERNFLSTFPELEGFTFTLTSKTLPFHGKFNLDTCQEE